jgi:hypothetical protein
MVWNFLVMCPVYALGFTNHLEKYALAGVAFIFFLLVMILARWRSPTRQFAAEIGAEALEMVRLPFEAVRVCARARSFATISVVFTFAALVWGIGCAYLMPSWKQWDALWYHEPMVGYAIQNHGFRFVDLPIGSAHKINGYPRLCEMTQLWIVIFTDRRFIDMVGYVAAPSLALSVYVLARRSMVDMEVAIAFGCALVLAPASVRVIGSTYVDAHNAAFILGAATFASRLKVRIRDSMLVAVCLALAVGSKQMALAPAGVLGVVTAWRLLPEVRRRPTLALGAIVLGLSVIVGVASMTYLRNWLHFGNPFWPDLKYDNPRWGIHWPGEVEWGTGKFDKGDARLDMNVPLSDLIETMARIPYSISLRSYDQVWEYGIGMTWVAFPLAALSLGMFAFAYSRGVIGRLVGRPGWMISNETRSLIPVAITLAVIVRFSPALWGSRYQIAAMGLALVMIAWLASRHPFRGIGEGVSGALSAMSIVSFFWMTPRTWLWWSEARAFAKIHYPQREFTPASAIEPTLNRWNGSPVVTETGMAREKELGPGSTLAFSADYGSYMALFWNNTYSNRAVYIPPGPDFMDRLRTSDATWAYCATGDPTCSGLSRPNSGWQLVGPLDIEDHGSVYRRVRK